METSLEGEVTKRRSDRKEKDQRIGEMCETKENPP